MLALERPERDELLEAFQRVISHLRESSDDKLIEALQACKDRDVDRALAAKDQALEFDHILTVIKSYLAYEYKKCVSLH